MTRTPGRAGAALGAAVAAVLTACSARDDGREAGPTTTPADTATATVTAESGPTVAFVGDSWTDGVGASGARGFPVLTAELLGWEFTELGVSGGGYVVPGAGGPFGSRIAEAVAADPDVIVVQGSLNEQRVGGDELGRAALETLTRLRAEAGPATEIVVVGAPYAPGTITDRIDRVNDALSGAAAAIGLRFVDPAAENWTDPADPGLWSDPIHPNDAGHRQIAERLAPVLEDVVER